VNQRQAPRRSSRAQDTQKQQRTFVKKEGCIFCLVWLSGLLLLLLKLHRRLIVSKSCTLPSKFERVKHLSCTCKYVLYDVRPIWCREFVIAFAKRMSNLMTIPPLVRCGAVHCLQEEARFPQVKASVVASWQHAVSHLPSAMRFLETKAAFHQHWPESLLTPPKVRQCQNAAQIAGR
jgi:hypothetical protein